MIVLPLGKIADTLTPVRTRFLIAYDDDDDASLFCEALCKIANAMTCYKVENGREVFEFLARPEIEKPEVTFSDINMPIMNGWECLKRLKPVLTLTTFALSCTPRHRQKEISIWRIVWGPLFFLRNLRILRNCVRSLRSLLPAPRDLY